MTNKAKLAMAAAVLGAGLTAYLQPYYTEAQDPTVKTACAEIDNGHSISEETSSGGRGGASKYGVTPSKVTCIIANTLG